MEKKRDSFFLSNKKQREFKPGNAQTEFGAENNSKFKTGNDKKNEFNNKRHEHFNKNRNGLEESKSNDENNKKPFDKKTYRLKKYSKKYKLDQWEEHRKKKLLRNYYKDVKNDDTSGSYTAKVFDEDTTDSTLVGKYVRHPDLIEKDVTNEPPPKTKKDPFFKAKEQYNKIKQEKLEKKQEIEKVKEEKKQKLQEYKKKKQERFKKLSKKTKKGQPVMTGRLELLLEKIQGSK